MRCTVALRRAMAGFVAIMLGGAVLIAAPPAETSPAPPAPASPAPARSEKPALEINPSAQALLKLLNTGSQERLSAHPGLRPEVVKQVMAYRASGKTFGHILEFRKLTKIQQTDFEAALSPFQEDELLRQLETTRKPVPAPGAAGKPAGRMAPRDAASGTAPGAAQPAQGATPAPPADPTAGPIGNVRVGYYSVLPGFPDLDKLDPVVRKEFLEAVNREKCACGCQDETIAWCLVNDEGCPVVKSRARKIYDDIVTKPPK